jgi:hypothetical protein
MIKKIVLASFIVPCLLFLSTKGYAQVDSSAAKDSLNQQALPDSSRVDSVRSDSVATPVVNDSSKVPDMTGAINYPFERQHTIKLDQKELANPEEWSITDTTDLSGKYFVAIQKHFSAPIIAQDSADAMNLFTVIGPQDTLPSTAMIEGYPYLRSFVNYHEQLNNLASSELKELKDSLAYHFRNKINIEVMLRSYQTRAVALDTSFWNVSLTAGDVALEPTQLIRSPIQSRVWGKVVWYQRKILLSFPRFAGANDLVYDPRLGLRIKMRKQSPDSSVYKSNYVFKFTKMIEGGSAYKQE